MDEALAEIYKQGNALTLAELIEWDRIVAARFRARQPKEAR